jgi:AraC-like DNA-binding protein
MLRYLAHSWRDFNVRPDPPAIRTCWEFYAVLEGNAAPQFENHKPIPPSESCIWLMQPGNAYHWKSNSGPIKRIAFHFINVPEMLKQRLGSEHFICHSLNEHDREIIIGLANLMMPYYLKPTELLELYSQKSVVELSLLFLEGVEHRHIRPLHRREYERVRKAEEWYQSHLKTRPTVEQVAYETRISISQMRRDFHFVYKLPPQIIFRRLRLYEATRLLSNTDWTIDQIYAESGFNSKVDFHRSFKSEYGLSPHQWRRKISV